MEHARLNRVWNWLPAFRAVAETEHLPTASRLLCVTPSALSRTVKQLEAELGQPLFVRVGRRLELSPAGHELLGALRESMSRIDHGLATVSAAEASGVIRVSAPEPFATAFALGALERLVASHPRVVPQLVSLSPSDACAWVAGGRLDLAVIDAPRDRGSLSTERLGALRYGVYCGEGHPLFEVPRPSLADLSSHAFVALPREAAHPWPEALERRVAMIVSGMHLAVEACATGRYLARLADVVAERHRGVALRRLPIELPGEHVAYAAHRAGACGAVAALLRELRAAFA
ncbi:MAG: LysR family transcriptional regulator [Sandaracinaceae bacterium]|nr:LysR family transcriptional regulator [Sandaracinaceae bacterium]